MNTTLGFILWICLVLLDLGGIVFVMVRDFNSRFPKG